MEGVMKFASFLLTILLTAAASGQTARDYYNELNRTNGLEGLSNEYVCFKDDATDGIFFTISKGNDIRRDLLLLNAGEKKMKTSDIDKFANTLVVTNYTKGVAGDLDVMDKDTNRTGVSTETFVDRGTVNKAAVALRFTINWKTLRFKRSVSVAGKVGDYAVYGRCEDRTVPNK
jgi:hypothetical protein